MRLIDADAVLDKMRGVLDMQDLYLPIHFKQFVIDEMPTVCDIEKIRAEIKEEYNDAKMREMDDETYGFRVSLEIIDKYTKGVSE